MFQGSPPAVSPQAADSTLVMWPMTLGSALLSLPPVKSPLSVMLHSANKPPLGSRKVTLPDDI